MSPSRRDNQADVDDGRDQRCSSFLAMTAKSPGIGSLVLVPALITLVVTILRLVGELQGWNQMLFNNGAPGPETPPALFGIFALVPIFGAWFGWRLRRTTGGPAHAGKAALLFAAGMGVLVGLYMAAEAVGLVVMPTKEAPGVPDGMLWVLGILILSCVVAFIAWPRLTSTLFVYAVLARIPVIAITFVAVEKNWDTHYTKLPAEFALPTGESKAMFLSIPQCTFWIAFTMLVGGLFGCLGAALTRRKD